MQAELQQQRVQQQLHIHYASRESLDGQFLQDPAKRMIFFVQHHYRSGACRLYSTVCNDY